MRHPAGWDRDASDLCPGSGRPNTQGPAPQMGKLGYEGQAPLLTITPRHPDTSVSATGV